MAALTGVVASRTAWAGRFPRSGLRHEADVDWCGLVGSHLHVLVEWS